MIRLLANTGLIALFCSAAFGQAPDPAARFEIADVHASPKTANPFVRNLPPRGGRYEIKTATMVDLIRIAYSFDADKVLGGPSWLEMDRFDVSARVPAEATPETVKPMLQSLLADRFQLVVSKETRPLPTYALTLGKKPQIKEADGSGDTGCKPQAASGPPPEGGIRLMTSSNGGPPITLNLGPGMTIQFSCRNMTMAAFAEGLRGMMGASVGPNPVLDQTGLKGRWNFDVRWSMQLNGPMMANTSDRITVFEAVDKQLGLKLEQQQVPTPVIVVASVNEKPTGNPPGLAEALPPIAVPTEFEVADVKAGDPEARAARFQFQQGGRLTAENMTMHFLMNRAFNSNNSDQVVGLPKWVDADKFNITAKAPSSGPTSPAMDMESVAPMMRALLAERFGLKYHTEDRQVSAYSLVASKPKMKKADPASRTGCRNATPPPGSPPGRLLTCQNITMAQFADQLQNIAAGLNWPVLDATGIEGGWDFTLTFTPFATMAVGGGGRGGEGGAAGDMPAASDPNGGFTIFEAIEKQLGLKLETQKRTMPVIVIDHLDEKPTDN